MSDCTCGKCPTGKYGCGCCYASVTGLRAGIHPDTIKSAHRDLILAEDATPSKTHESMHLVAGAIHIISVEINLVTVYRDLDEADLTKQLLVVERTGAEKSAVTPVTVSLFTLPGYTAADLNKGGFNPAENEESDRSYFCSGAVTPYSPSYQSPPDIFGRFCDGGLFVEYNAATPYFGARIVVNYVDRMQFSPAYHDPVEVMQHYWACSHEEEFLDGFYGGFAFDIEALTPNATSSRGTNPFYVTASEDTMHSWDWH